MRFGLRWLGSPLPAHLPRRTRPHGGVPRFVTKIWNAARLDTLATRRRRGFTEDPVRRRGAVAPGPLDPGAAPRPRAPTANRPPGRRFASIEAAGAPCTASFWHDLCDGTWR